MGQEAAASLGDRRIARSRAALRRAFIELINERGLENFSINDLCAHAGLNRGTFYNHFKDKEDLLNYFEQEILQGLEKLQEEFAGLSLGTVWAYNLSKRPLPVLVHLFDNLAEDSDFLCAILSPRGDAAFAHTLQEIVCNHLILGILHDKYRNQPTTFVNYYIAYYASAYMGILERWMETGMQETSEEMAVIALRLLFIKPGESIEL